MEPKLIENSSLDKWMTSLWKIGIIPYLIFAAIAFFNIKIGVILSILWIGIRTEFLFATLRYGDTINSRRLELVEDNIELKIDYDNIHSRKG